MTLSLERVPNLTVMELRKELKTRGEEAKGNKKVLVERLTAALEKEKAAEPPAPKRGRGRPPKKRDEPKKEEPKEEPKPAPPEPAKEEPAVAKETNTTVEEDDNPLSEARMKRRAERFGMPWPRENGEKEAKRAKTGKEPAIAPYTLTDDEIKRREARAKRFAEEKTEEAKEEKK